MEKTFENLLNIDFGDIDGMYDPKLSDYFIDRGFWENIIEKNKYFVIGRKGTGKSALYNWIKGKSYEKGNLCENILFNEFPFQKLLLLKDESFLQPNQYQTICRNMILSEFARLIVWDEEHLLCEEFSEIEYYDKYVNGEDIVDCFRKSVTHTDKKAGQLQLTHLNLTNEEERSTGFDFYNVDLNVINNKLENAILRYLKIYACDKKIIIQVDGIDENYTQLSREQNVLDDYFQFVICLLKATYTINQKIHRECADMAKCIIYLRSDIFYAIHKLDAESARWEQQTEYLNWTVIGDGWEKSDLRKLINARILCSLPELREMEDGFNEIFNRSLINLKERMSKYYYRTVENLFEYISIRTFYRPRDVIQFCIKIQDCSKRMGCINYKSFREGEKEYSLWFLSEITNEISANIKNVDALFTMLRTIGGRPLSISRFKSIYLKYQKEIGYTADEILKYLYEVSIIYNINDKGEVFSSIRNDRSRLNPDIKICLHPGFWKGLYVSTY